MNRLRTLSEAKMNLPILTPPDGATLQNFFFPVFWGAGDRDAVTELAKAVTEQVQPGFHFADNFLTWGRNNSMFDDGPFVKAWQSNAEGDSDIAIVWRRYVLACAAYHAVHLDGDFVECGCYRGVGVKTIVDYLGGAAFPRTFWGYDLFEHAAGMEHHSMADHGPDLADVVRAKFAGYHQVNIVQGEIPAVFAGQSLSGSATCTSTLIRPRLRLPPWMRYSIVSYRLGSSSWMITSGRWPIAAKS